jgi:hypothetical protein
VVVVRVMTAGGAGRTPSWPTAQRELNSRGQIIWSTATGAGVRVSPHAFAQIVPHGAVKRRIGDLISAPMLCRARSKEEPFAPTLIAVDPALRRLWDRPTRRQGGPGGTSANWTPPKPAHHQHRRCHNEYHGGQP